MRECFFGLARVGEDRVLNQTQLKTSQLCFDWEGVAQSWRTRSETVEESGEKYAYARREGDGSAVPFGAGVGNMTVYAVDGARK